MKHSNNAILISLSRLLERAGYYGFRSLLVLYLVGETMNLEPNKAIGIYAMLTVSIIFSQLIGGVIGDLVLGTKRTYIIGGILQALGAVTLILENSMSMYLGIGLISLGCGFYSPNILSQFSKTYYKKPKLLDAGFTLFYLVISIGSMLGVLILSTFEDNFKIAFIIVSIIFLLATFVAFFTNNSQDEFTYNSNNIGKNIGLIFASMILIGVFWGIYEFTATPVYLIQANYSEILGKEFLSTLLTQSNIFMIVFGSIFIFIWSYFYLKQYWKLILGFLIATLAIGILLFIPEIPSEGFKIYFIVSTFFLALAELLIAPTVLSLISKYSNPKYLGIIFSFMFIITFFFTKVFGNIQNEFASISNATILTNGSLTLFVIAIFISIASVLYYLIKKNKA